MRQKKALFWVSSSKKDLAKFPRAVQDSAFFALDIAREGESPQIAKTLKGFNGASVKELVLEDRAGTFRVVYTVQVKDAIYVLHAFQKKSKKGIKTSKQDIDLIYQRLQMALTDSKERTF